MIPFTRLGDVAVASFEPAEADVLIRLATEVQELLAQADDVVPHSPGSRAIDRLLPAGYGDEGELDAEFRRFTSKDLIDRKVRNAQSVIDALSPADGSAGPVSLDAAAVQAWLRCLTDVRLAIAAGLGIEHDDDEPQLAGPDRYLLEVYRWVAFVQESLISTLEADFS
ncbi:hypothetical protein TZ00_02070 [Agreia bicolorata]|uniref:DUF2017 domain-containing protein n=1 Tax=Agreia bicolorata TaxID=110935 RepID=A0ABR5CK19_9MICO|nr:hypothetical protein TZ00_02070 [Agreia bicolorata]